MLVMGSSYPAIYYNFACSQVQHYRLIFLAIITATSSITFVSTMLPAMNKPKFRTLRGLMFIVLGLSAAFPFIFAIYIV
jgi:predicted membrane channel-forming protein YqfA (hemolysin III family)